MSSVIRAQEDMNDKTIHPNKLKTQTLIELLLNIYYFQYANVLVNA